jgi:hypothetical protein
VYIVAPIDAGVGVVGIDDEDGDEEEEEDEEEEDGGADIFSAVFNVTTTTSFFLFPPFSFDFFNLASIRMFLSVSRLFFSSKLVLASSGPGE